MTEATVHALFKIEMIVRIDEMGPIEMSVDTEHLSEDSLADLNKFRWETTALANPIALASELRKRDVQSSRASWDRRV